jgi:hypothetical protein
MRFSGHKTLDTFRRYNMDDVDDLRGVLRQKARYVSKRKEKPAAAVVSEIPKKFGNSDIA